MWLINSGSPKLARERGRRAGRRRAALPLLALLCGAVPAAGAGQAAAASSPPPRPRPALPAGADTNDWERYYDRGTELVRQRRGSDADAAFYWASRLNPARAEPLYGRFVAFWMQDPERLERFLREDPQVVMAPEVLRTDSLRHLALLRNPLVFQGQLAAAFDRLPGTWRDDPITTGWIEYANLKFGRAAMFWNRALHGDSVANYWLRYDLALADVGLDHPDSARTELGRLVATMRQREERQLLHVWASKAFFQYAIARVDAALGDAAGARAALEDALVEDLSFFQAHATLAQLAIAGGDLATALREYGEALTIAPGDPMLHYEYGRALATARRLEEAAAQFRQVVAAEPYFADGYLALGATELQRGEQREALDALRGFVARAPRDSPSLDAARRQVDALATSLGAQR